MSYYGDIALGKTIDIKFTTRRFSTGAPFTLAGTPAVSAYPDNSTTQITAGITLTVDFDSVTGLNNIRVVATSGNGYATATNYDLVITAGTVDSVSVAGEVVGAFSIENRSSLRPTTADRTLDVSAGGEAGVDWANVGSPTTVVGLSGTTVKTATDVETDTADIQSRLPAALTAGGNMKADALALSGDTVAADNAEAFFDGTGYAGTGNTIPTVTTVTNQVTANVTGISGDATAADNLEAMLDGTGSVTLTTNVTGNITGNLSGSVGSVTGAVGSVTGAVGSVTGAVGSVAAGGITAASIATGAVDADAFAADAVAEIADGVWDEARSGHTTAGTYGESQSAIVNGAAIAGTLSTTQMTTDLTEATDDHYNGRTLIWVSGALTGQATNITDYTGATKLLTYTAVTEAPTATDKFIIV